MKKIIVFICFMLVVLLGSCSYINTITKANYSYDDADKYSVLSTETSFSAITAIDMEYISGDVDITVSSNNDVLLSEEIDSDAEEKYYAHYYHDGSTLKIRFTESMNKLSISFKVKKLHLEIPASLNDFECLTISADVSMDSFTGTEFEMETISGDIEIDSINAVNTDIDTVSGKLIINNIISDNIDINTTSGNIKLYNLASKTLDLDTVSGHITLAFIAEATTLTVNTTSGDVNIDLPESAEFAARFRSTSGDFSSNFETTKEDKLYVRGSGSMSISVKTVSGDCDITKS